MAKNYNVSNELVIGKMKDKTSGVATEELVGLKPKMYLYLVDDNSEHKKTKDVSRNEYIYVLLNNKCMKHLKNRI